MPAARPSQATIANVLAAMRQAGIEPGAVCVSVDGKFTVQPRSAHEWSSAKGIDGLHYVSEAKKAEWDWMATKLALTSTYQRGVDPLMHLDMKGIPRARIGRSAHGPNLSPKIRQMVIERDGKVCAYCRKTVDAPQIDHIHPRSRGGTNEMSNLTVACRPCNLSKRAKTLDEWKRGSS